MITTANIWEWIKANVLIVIVFVGGIIALIVFKPFKRRRR
jgi:hypothetical protein